MRKILFIVLIFNISMTISYSSIYQSSRTLGDINDDGEINVIDVVLLVSYILDGLVDENGDMNQYDFLDIIDVVLLVEIIINQDTVPDSGLFVSQQYLQDDQI